MKQVFFAGMFLLLAGFAATAHAGPDAKPGTLHAEGCVQPGVEARCLVLKDVKSGKLYNLLVKEPRPAIGDGIEFTAAPFEGMTYCMQGIAVTVSSWSRKDSLKCTQAAPPGK